MDDLFSPDDPDLLAQQEGSQEYYLRVAGESIRTYIGWHLAPNIGQVSEVTVGGKGIAMLPSKYVTLVHGVYLIDRDSQELVEPRNYYWDQLGWIEFFQQPLIGQRLRVEFRHGYDDVPMNVKAVAYEMVAANANAPVGTSASVKGMVSPAGYRLEYGSPTSVPGYGFNLNDDQKSRLAAYKLSWAI